ncbi:glutamine synthetase family protein [Thermoflexus sp.]|uniref:glutamine synthetase family protein n=1 Tax=Thermoflexus sp. TaxID=1969742 RepID=UPI0035E4106D
MHSPAVDPNRVLEEARQAGVRFVILRFTDILGAPKGVTIPLEDLPEAIETGKWFDGSAIEGFARVAESDLYLKPDLSTFTVLPWTRGEGTTAHVICWVVNRRGERFAGDPRAVLARVMERAARMGYAYVVSPELEFYLFRAEGERFAPAPHDEIGYFDLATDLAYQVRCEMVETLRALGIPAGPSHHEISPGQHEIDFQPADALRMADYIVTARLVIKHIAQAHGLHATFMPKPLEGRAGSGMHTHQSLLRLEGGGNAFADPEDDYGLSALAKSFLAGQIAHARGMCAVLCPLVNSYKRLLGGFEAPLYVSWARINRSALIRIPAIKPGRYQSTRLELRSLDPACNPYLAFAAMLAAGLDGIERRLPLPPPVEEELFPMESAELEARGIQRLPATLGEALEALEADEVIQEALGPLAAERFLEAKRLEWDAYCRHVSAWEIDRYFHLY